MNYIKIIFFFLLFSFPANTIFGWGFFAHRKINHLAVFTLPEPLFGLFKKHIDFLSENAVNPDRRRYATKDEAPRHYIDIDHYGENPFENVPRRWKEAVEKFTEDTLMAHGIVPWHIERMLYRLTEAFKEKNLDRILFLAADLGHYISDAHVPLHCTKNYNGQLTNQHGIHGLWESRIPELKAEEYDFFVGKAFYIDKPLDQAWEIVESSFAAVDSVLAFERELTKEFPTDRKFTFEQRGASTMRVYTEEFAAGYHNMLAGMVERRMRSSIIITGSYWFTAWVMAGQPDLSNIEDKKISEELKEKLKEEENMWRTGKAPVGKGHED